MLSSDYDRFTVGDGGSERGAEEAEGTSQLCLQSASKLHSLSPSPKENFRVTPLLKLQCKSLQVRHSHATPLTSLMSFQSSLLCDPVWIILTITITD